MESNYVKYDGKYHPFDSIVSEQSNDKEDQPFVAENPIKEKSISKNTYTSETSTQNQKNIIK